MVASILEEKGYKRISLSDMIRKVVADKHLSETRENLIETGNWMRKRDGVGILARMAAEQERGNPDSMLVIETVRNPAEAEILRDRLGCELWAIDAPLELRYKRLAARKREGDPMSFEEFEKINNRDMGQGEPVNGQQVGKCIEMANVMIVNDGSEKALRKQIEELLKPGSTHTLLK